jgi:hypothetical protein
MKLITIDSRHRGYGNWKYFVRFKKLLIYPHGNMFHEYRKWCWEQWGPSKELSEFSLMHSEIYCDNKHWCWDNGGLDKEFRLYFKNDIDASMFMLQWQ